MASFAADLWNSHLITVEENRQFVDSKLLDEVCGVDLTTNKFRKIEIIITDMVAGTIVQPRDLLRKMKSKTKKNRICVAARTMQLIILRGFKEMPWNEARRKLVALFFPQDMIPDVDPYTARYNVRTTSVTAFERVSIDDVPHVQTVRRTGAPILPAILPQIRDPRRLKRYVEAWCRPGGSVSFWRQVFWFVRYRGIRLQGLVDFARETAGVRNRQTRKGSLNITKTLIDGLLSKRGLMRNFCDNLAIAMRTGNMETLINVIRGRLAVTGLRCNIVPSIRSIKISTATLVRNFIAICKPERTYSGFRVQLVACVKLAAFFLLKKTDINDIQVDIWGDAVEIGGIDVTRMTFRLLCDKISAQSSEAVFCFAAYRGKDGRFPLEQNIGPSVVGEQESGWLYQQTCELKRLGAKLTYSGDSPFLLRLILGISNEKSKEFPSMLPLYVSDEAQQTFLPTMCHPETGRRTDLNIPFRRDVPKISLVCVDDVRCICSDTTHMITRCVETDCKKMAQKICDDKNPHEADAVRRFEDNLTAREAKKPVFRFTRTTPQQGPGKVECISLSGSGALTVIADTLELQAGV